MHRQPYNWLIVFLFAFSLATAQNHSGKILNELQKLQNTTSVLYLAAHPDDENTRMISWLVNDLGVRTGYLSLTRGDGGQNLIGNELNAELGVLRTQELMQARAIDGGQQFFSRAVDFGYSKTASETFDKWGKQKILSDAVWVIRKFKPDVIVTRFPADDRGGHGHHTASAILAIEAFKKAADKTQFPEQLEYVDTWQPKRLYWNSSVWWNRKLDSIARANPDFITTEVGGYSPFLGRSYNEIASYSRTQHKSQGFGVSVSRGKQLEYLKYMEGSKAQESLFEGVISQWARYAFPEGDKMLDELVANFNPEEPQQSVPGLLLLHDKAEAINDSERRLELRNDILEIVKMCLGLHLECNAASDYYIPGDTIAATLEAITRTTELEWRALEIGGKRVEIDTALQQNKAYDFEVKLTAPAEISQPYWLKKPYGAVFQVDDQELIGKPENEPAVKAHFHLAYADQELSFSVPLQHKYSDRVDGEITKPVFIIPEVTVGVTSPNMVFVNKEAQQLQISATNHSDKPATLKIDAEGWDVEPDEIKLPVSNVAQDYSIRVKPDKKSETSTLKIFVNKEQARQMQVIDYEHIDRRVVFKPAQARLIAIDLEKKGERIGYIMGPGDEVPRAIRQMGYQVDMLDEAALKSGNLERYKTIVTGIRSYNTEAWLPQYRDKLMQYVQNGGNFMVQYNTRSRDLLTTELGPYPFELSRKRVTEEKSEVNMEIAEHPVLNTPNKITQKDFENWVQERGLYFAGEWSEKYQTPISWHDAGEEPLRGGLLIGHYGEGSFIYTGISFFRQLPAGVSGGYRLFANLLSYENEQ